MIQSHTILLWREPDTEIRDFDEIATEAFEIMNVFQEFNEAWRPNYLVGYRKNKNLFEWNYENFYRELKKGVNHEVKKVFEELGYIIGFFSSQDDDEAFGHSLGIGNTSYLNVLSIHISLNLDLQDKTNADTIVLLFEKLVGKYSPFWGAVTNSFIANKYAYFDCLKGLPNTVYWVNYFNDSVIENIGAKKINRLLEQYPDMHFENGILRIKDTAIDYEAEGDMQLHGEVHKNFFTKN